MLGGFNQTGFNQEIEIFIQFQGDIDSQSDIYTKTDNELILGFNQLGFNNVEVDDTELLIIDLPIVFSMDSDIESISEAGAIFSTRFKADIESITETEGLIIKIQSLQSHIESIAEAEGKIKRFKTEGITFTGDFKARDKIVIDMDKYTVTLNGQNALHLIEGDFFNLQPGLNDLIYIDTESNRKVKIQVEYRDRWL